MDEINNWWWGWGAGFEKVRTLKFGHFLIQIQLLYMDEINNWWGEVDLRSLGL